MKYLWNSQLLLLWQHKQFEDVPSVLVLADNYSYGEMRGNLIISCRCCNKIYYDMLIVGVFSYTARKAEYDPLN